MPATRQYLHADARREQILRSARALFAESGYRQLTTGEIAQATGVSWSLIAHYYGDKGGLYAAVLGSIADSAKPVEVPDGPLEVRVAAYIERGVTTMERSRESWWAATDGWDGGQDTEVARIIERGRQRTASALISVFGDDAPDLDEPALITLALCAITLGETAATEWIRRRHQSRDQVIAFITQATIAIFDAAARTLAQVQSADGGHG